jgi:hypothetical protein
MSADSQKAYGGLAGVKEALASHPSPLPLTAAYNHGGRWQDPRGALRDAAEALGEPRAGPVDKGDGKG